VAYLDVSGNFLITIGHGDGPEMVVVLSVCQEDGNPKDLHFGEPPHVQSPVDVFVVLSAKFGETALPLRVVRVTPMGPGYYGLRVGAPSDLGVRLEQTRPSVLGIVVDDGTDRGQALACSCGGADVTSWVGERVQEPHDG
jgi:hypothetical protein